MKDRSFQVPTSQPEASLGQLWMARGSATHSLPATLHCSQRLSGLWKGLPSLTDDREDACGLCRPKGVGDLTNVGATVLSPQVTDGQPCDALGPAAVGREGPAILEPADGRDGVAGGGAGQLHCVARPHFL